MKKAVSFTLDADNLLWLRGRATARRGSVSAVVDQLITEARLAGNRPSESIRSVVGTIDLPEDDPDLRAADEYVRAAFGRSQRQPVLVKERRVRYSARSTRG